MNIGEACCHATDASLQCEVAHNLIARLSKNFDK